MEDIGIRVKRGTFTVEAAVVMTMTVWVIFSLCYFAMFLHDRVVVFSLSKEYLSEYVRQEETEKLNPEQELKTYLEKSLLICRPQTILVEPGKWYVQADIVYSADVSLPIARYFLKQKRRVHVTQKWIAPVKYMWDSQAVKKAVGKSEDDKKSNKE